MTKTLQSKLKSISNFSIQNSTWYHTVHFTACTNKRGANEIHNLPNQFRQDIAVYDINYLARFMVLGYGEISDISRCGKA